MGWMHSYGAVYVFSYKNQNKLELWRYVWTRLKTWHGIGIRNRNQNYQAELVCLITAYNFLTIQKWDEFIPTVLCKVKNIKVLLTKSDEFDSMCEQGLRPRIESSDRTCASHYSFPSSHAARRRTTSRPTTEHHGKCPSSLSQPFCFCCTHGHQHQRHLGSKQRIKHRGSHRW